MRNYGWAFNFTRKPLSLCAVLNGYFISSWIKDKRIRTNFSQNIWRKSKTDIRASAGRII